jgi:hypothetical protein
MRTIALFLILILFTPGCAKTMTNVVGDQRTCKVENVMQSVYVCSGREACGLLGGVALIFALISVAAYHACVYQAHEEGFE